MLPSPQRPAGSNATPVPERERPMSPPPALALHMEGALSPTPAPIGHRERSPLPKNRDYLDYFNWPAFIL